MSTPEGVTSPLDREPAPSHPGMEVSRTRTGRAWTATAFGLVVLLAVIDFIAQNSQQSQLHFLGINGRVPVGLTVLLAAVLGAVLAMVLSGARLAQLRLAARRHDRH